MNAGPGQTVKLPNGANLDGSVTDDGLPNPPGAVTTTWENVTGFGTVTFGNPNAVDTTAQFSVEGTYVLRLTATTVRPASRATSPSPWCARDRRVDQVRHRGGGAHPVQGRRLPGCAGQPVLLQRPKGSDRVKVRTKHLEAGQSVYTFDIRRDDSGHHYRTRVPRTRARRRPPSAVPKGLLLRVYRPRSPPCTIEVISSRDRQHGASPWTSMARASSRSGRDEADLTDLVVRPDHVVRIHSGDGKSDKNDLYLSRKVSGVSTQPRCCATTGRCSWTGCATEQTSAQRPAALTQRTRAGEGALMKRTRRPRPPVRMPAGMHGTRVAPPGMQRGHVPCRALTSGFVRHEGLNPQLAE